MSKTFTDLTRHALNGATMGTRWSALFYAVDLDPGPIHADLQAAVDQVDAQMSNWRPDSDLMRLNHAAPGEWVPLPPRLIEVLDLALRIGAISGGAFDIAVGDAVAAWGFGPDAADTDRIRAALTAPRIPAAKALEIGASRARRLADATFDLGGIAKGYGVDRLFQVLAGHGITDALVAIDGELRAAGTMPDRAPWPVAIEAPLHDRRTAQSVLTLQDAAVATSGDYRHWIDAGGQRLSHTMDPGRGGPLAAPPASVTVVAQDCVAADAWATALMVRGVNDGIAMALRLGLQALFLTRDGRGGVRAHGVGALFEGVGVPA